MRLTYPMAQRRLLTAQPWYELPSVLARNQSTLVRAAPGRPQTVPSSWQVLCRRSLSCSQPQAQGASSASPATDLSGIGSISLPGHRPSRSADAGRLSAKDEGRKVILAGWLLPGRKFNAQLTFFPLRDQTGIVQLVVKSDLKDSASGATLSSISSESIVHIEGSVQCRPEGQVNSAMSTGEIEIDVTKWTLLNPANAALPFQPSDEYNLPNEELRAQHRYLDLRRRVMTANMRLRSNVTHRIRSFLHDEGFHEIETPLLLRSTPEGAREFLVPTRMAGQDGEPTFYALPQSPQQPKQILMASGVTDKYFQIARCFRDESSRKDRQPEFTQVDLEMAFIDGQPAPDLDQAGPSNWRMGGIQVRRVIEGMMRQVWLEAKGEDLFERQSTAQGFDVMTYDEAMTRFGSDKPDVRFALEIVDLGEYIKTRDIAAEHDEDEAVEKETVEILAFRVPRSTSTGKDKAQKAQPDSNPFSNSRIQQLIKDKSGMAGSLERFKSPEASPHSLANLLLQKSAHIKAYLSQEDIQAEEVEVELLASGIATAISRGQFGVGCSEPDDDYESETHVFISRRPARPVGGSTELGELRIRLRDVILEHNLRPLPTQPHFLWITEFPLFTQSDDEKNALTSSIWSSTHHPFTAPLHSDIPSLLSILTRLHQERINDPQARSLLSSPDLSSALSKIKGQHYDLVLNGCEIGGGSVRIHSRLLQEAIMTLVLGLDGGPDGEIQRFRHLLDALDSGCPPHGGIALGLDRLMTFLVDPDIGPKRKSKGKGSEQGASAAVPTPSLRDVIAFPKMSNGKDLLFGSPAAIGQGDEKESGANDGNTTEESVVLGELGLARKGKGRK